MLSLFRAFVASPIFLELVRQFLRWVGVWLMTIGVPESIVGLTANEDAVMGVVGFIMYLVADAGWLEVKWKQFKEWRARA
jgi:hypothetical protein